MMGKDLNVTFYRLSQLARKAGNAAVKMYDASRVLEGSPNFEQRAHAIEMVAHSYGIASTILEMIDRGVMKDFFNEINICFKEFSEHPEKLEMLIGILNSIERISKERKKEEWTDMWRKAHDKGMFNKIAHEASKIKKKIKDALIQAQRKQAKVIKFEEMAAKKKSGKGMPKKGKQPSRIAA